LTELDLTPSQTVGPYLKIGLLDGMITPRLVDDADARALTIRGRLLDGAGDPVPDGMIELWQANPSGRYRHPHDVREQLQLEDGFVGFGRSGTSENGVFTFTTLKPGRVPWPGGGQQAPHVLIGVFARGMLKQAVTRMYFPDEPAANAEDPILARLDAESRRTLVAASGPDGELCFDIVLQGHGQTTFFAV
jgi:protocatechuate 3,4-dioxygenase alpha subunit